MTPSSNLRSSLAQILAVSIKNTILFIYGTSIGMPTILIPNLDGSDLTESIAMDQEELSWVASLNSLIVPIGCVCSGIIAGPFGRKIALQLVALPFLFGFLLLHFASRSWYVFAGLSLMGLAGGLSESPGVTYAAEVTDPRLRGALCTTSTLAVNLGILFTFILGTFYHWRTVALVNGLVPVMAVFLFFFVPETPYWLISKNQLEKGQRSLAWLRGWTAPDSVSEEFASIKKSIEKDARMERRRRFDIEPYTKRRFLKPYLLISFAFVLSYFGNGALTPYIVVIFNSVRVPISSYYATIATGTANLVAISISLVTVRFFGKRRLSFLSLGGVFASFLVSAIYTRTEGIFHFDDADVVTPTLTWIPLVSVMGVGFFAYLMIIGLPWILMSEIYYHEIRDTATGLSAATGYVLGFVASKTFVNLVDAIGLPGAFGVYGGVAAVGAVVLYYCLPETEGKTLFEISEHYDGGEKLDNKVGI